MTELIESYEEVSTGEVQPRVATLDMGGTLVDTEGSTSTHAYINRQLGLSEEEDRELYNRFTDREGDLHHQAHADSVSSKLRGRPEATLDNYAGAVQDLLEDRSLMEGAREFVEEMELEGYTTVVVSSAPKAVTMPFADQLNIEFVYGWKDYEFSENGDFHRIEVNEEAYGGKQDVVEGLQDQGFDVAHFGNGDNDKRAVEEADAGIRQWWQANPETSFNRAIKEARTL